MTMRSDEQPLSTADIARGTTTTEPREPQAERTDLDRAENSSELGNSGPIQDRPVREEPPTVTTKTQSADDGAAPLFAAADGERFHTRWTDVQAGFVDDPRHAVEQADGLVAEVIKNLAEAFSGERSGLEQQWQKGEDVSTEELRLALRRYRSFFDRLLSV